MLVPIDQYKKQAQPSLKTGKLKPLPMKQKVAVQPVRPDIKQSPNYLNAVSNADRYSQEAQKAGSFMGIAKETGKGVAQSLYQAVPRFIASVAETPGIVARGGQTNQKTYHLPVLGDFQSYQSEAQNTFNDVIDNKKPLYAALKPFVDVPLAGWQTGALASGLLNFAKGVSTKPQQITLPRDQVRQQITKLQPSKSLDNIPVPKNVSGKTVSTSYPSPTLSGSKSQGFIETVKSSPMTAPEVRKAVMGTYTPRTTDALAQKATKLISTNIDKARDIATTQTDDEGVATAMELIKHYQNKGDFDSAVQVAEDIAPKLTEMGRSIQAASIYNRLTPEGILRYATRQLNQANAANPKLKLSLDSETAKELTELAKTARKLSGEERVIATQAMLDRVQELIPTPNVQKAITLWKAGLLTNPSTQVANLTGNTSMLALENVKDVPATAFDKLASIFTGKRTKAFPNLQAQGMGFREGVKKGAAFFKTGVDPEDVLSKVDYKKVKFDSPILQKYTDTVFRGLGTGDKVFRQVLLRKSLSELAAVDGLNKGLSGANLAKHIETLGANPTTDMLEVATKDALYGTFNSKNALAEFISRGKGALGNYKAVADFIMPFTRTPTNIAARIADYSPIGYAKALAQAFTGSGQRNVVESLGRATVGTGIAGIGYGLAKQGQATGTLPTNETERNLWELQGKQPNSVRVGNKYLNLEKISPVGNLIGAGANTYQLGKSKSGGDLVSAIAGSTAKGLTDQTFLQGVSGALGAIQQPERYAERFFENTAGSVVPSIIAALARQLDPVRREVNTAGEAIQNRLPFLKSDLLPRRNALGGEIRTDGNQFINPFRPTKAVEDPVATEFERLRGIGANPTLSDIGKTMSYKGQKIKLSPEELDLIESEAGPLTRRVLEETFKQPIYQNASSDEQENIIAQVISKTREVSKAKKLGTDERSVIDSLQKYLSNKQIRLNPFYTQ